MAQTGGESIVSAQDAISLYFRTRQPNGLLFYTGEWIPFMSFAVKTARVASSLREFLGRNGLDH